jgi:hypothetical protein
MTLVPENATEGELSDLRARPPGMRMVEGNQVLWKGKVFNSIHELLEQLTTAGATRQQGHEP